MGSSPYIIMNFTKYLRITLAALTVGCGALAGNLSAAIADFAGSYEAKLSTTQTVGEVESFVFFGRLELTVAAKANKAGQATASGKLSTRDGKSYSFTTTFEERQNGTGPGGAPVTLLRNTNVVILKNKFAAMISMTLTLHPDGRMEGLGNNFQTPAIGGVFFPEDTFKFITFTGKTGSTPAWLGKYTMAFINPEPAGATVPAGAGYATMTVLNTGELSYKGKTGDGFIITGKAKPTAAGDYSLYVVPNGYAAGGYLSGTINLTDAKLGLQAEPAIWNKVAKVSDKAYPAGFSTVLDVIVREWFVPAKGVYPFGAALGFGSSKNFAVAYSGEGLSDGTYTMNLPDTLRITGLGVVQAVSGGVGAPVENNSKEWNKLWSVKLNSLTGSFTGTQVLTHLVGTKVVTRKLPVEGVMVIGNTLGATPFAYGQYRVTPKATGSKEVSGLVTFTGPLEDNTAVATAGTYTVRILEEDVVDVVTKVSGAQTFATKPVRPTGSPVTGQVVKFTVSEDLQTLTFNGQVLKYVGPGLSGRVYHKVVIGGLKKPGGQFGVTIRINNTTGMVEDVFGFTQFITLLNFSGDSRAQSTVFKALPPSSTSVIKLP